jgi:hypothetical protein
MAMGITLSLGALSIAGCSTTSVGPLTGAPASAPELPPVDVPFAKLIQPAFSNDYAERSVRFSAVFYGIQTQVYDIPSSFRQNHLRISLCSDTPLITLGGAPVMDCKNHYHYVVVPKENSEGLFSLEEGAKVAVSAKAHPMEIPTSAGSIRKLLLVVDSIEKQ